ncbi:hemolysin III family protein [Sulfitobacter sp. F26169L]|uniref:PAQR family membrane homeostasis protein TrhA n=1 Tax=Sulfitobacter sp. F26169L TaxID=2996015 RepID=UPI0022609DCB|nr:hemolysin III family protein [Sulfitobacter sp. F26169L]MCX7567189.1 hemolysin III family protein [Sulfitobacter sp. F26169L]
MNYPHSKPETVADGLVHAAGVAFSLPAVGVLVVQTRDDTALLAAVVFYGVPMIFAFMASALYHMSPVDSTRPLLNRIDHAAIYFKIAGTYTPFVALIGSAFAYVILGLVWALAIIGASAKLRGWGADARGSLALYLGMGWLSVLLIRAMWETLPHSAVALIIVGGAIYSLGTIVYSRDSLPYQNAIWHSFVLVASICFFAAISLSI